MTDSLLVVMDDTVAGTLVRLQGGRLRFDYSDEYRARPHPTPLSLSMPTQVRSHPDNVITPVSYTHLDVYKRQVTGDASTGCQLALAQSEFLPASPDG